jgi:hypothetical protein
MTFGAIDPLDNPTSVSYADHTSESLTYAYNALSQLTGISGSASESYSFNQPTTTPYYNIGNLKTKGSATYT